MTSNEHLSRLLEVDVVQQFIKKHSMQHTVLNDMFVLYRLPFVIGITDYLIENYLPMTLSDLSYDLLIEGGPALACSLAMNLQNIEQLRQERYDHHPLLNIFMSEGANKMDNLYSHLDAFDKLLPLIEERGGLVSHKNGTFDLRFDFSDSVQPIYPWLKAQYLKGIK